MAGRIKMAFELRTAVGPRNYVLDGSSVSRSPMGRDDFFSGGAADFYRATQLC